MIRNSGTGIKVKLGENYEKSAANIAGMSTRSYASSYLLLFGEGCKIFPYFQNEKAFVQLL